MENKSDLLGGTGTLDVGLVIPVFNEVESIDIFLERIIKIVENNPSLSFELIFVNDGSTDLTLEKLISIQIDELRVKVIDLSRNFGKEAALSAGLQFAKNDVVVPIDVDLQDPPEIILEMIEKWKEGYEVILGRRINRDVDSLAKRMSASFFYKVHNKISNLKIPENVGDFRLMDRRVVDALGTLPESHRFMKGLFAWVGFRTAYVDYVRPERAAGATKFNGWRLWNFALEGVTSFSTEPLRIWTYVGFFISSLSFVWAVFIAARVFLDGVDLPGYASLMVAVTFFGGLQLIGIGVIGEYLGRAYIESKRRPVFLVRRIYKQG